MFRFYYKYDTKHIFHDIKTPYKHNECGVNDGIILQAYSLFVTHFRLDFIIIISKQFPYNAVLPIISSMLPL